MCRQQGKAAETSLKDVKDTFAMMLRVLGPVTRTHRSLLDSCNRCIRGGVAT